MRFIVVLAGSNDPTLMNQPVTVEEEVPLAVDPVSHEASVLLCVVTPEPWAVTAVEHHLRLHNVPYLRDDHEGVLSVPDGHGNQVRLRWVADSADPDADASIHAAITGMTREGSPWTTEECRAITLWRAIEDAMTTASRLGR